MNGAAFRLIFLLIFISSAYSDTEEKTIVCNVINQLKQAKFNVGRDVAFQFCSIVIYSFLTINSTTNKIEPKDEFKDLKTNSRGLGLVDQLVARRDTLGSSCKIIVSVGGAKSRSDMADTAEKIETFANSVIDFLAKHELDGVDINWQPAASESAPADKINFVELLKVLRSKLQNKLLTVYLSGQNSTINRSYNISSFSPYVDFFNIKTFGYTSESSKMTGMNSPLKSQNGLNVDATLGHLIKKGATPSKILLGIPTYGECMNMKNIPEDGVYLGVPSDKEFNPKLTNSKGYIGYNEVCNLINSEPWKLFYDKVAFSPYMVKGNTFCTYDDLRSVEQKIKFALAKGLAGVNVWGIDTDDFKGVCGSKYPMLRLINSYFKPKIWVNPKNSKSHVISHSYP